MHRILLFDERLNKDINNKKDCLFSTSTHLPDMLTVFQYTFNKKNTVITTCITCTWIRFYLKLLSNILGYACCAELTINGENKYFDPFLHLCVNSC